MPQDLSKKGLANKIGGTFVTVTKSIGCVSKPNVDFVLFTAGLTQTINVGVIPANALLIGRPSFNLAEVFAGGAVATATVQVSAGTSASYAAAKTVFTGATLGVTSDDATTATPSVAPADRNVGVLFTSTVGNLTACTTGKLTVKYTYMVLD